MLDKIKDIVIGGKQNPEEIEPFFGVKLKDPKHMAFTIDGTLTYSKNGKTTISETREAYLRTCEVIKMIFLLQQKRKIPIMTFYISGKREENNSNYDEFLECLIDFFNDLQNFEPVASGVTKVSFLGKWYDLPGKVVESVKSILDYTKGNDELQVNFCLNYDGQEEIVDACKLLVRQVMASKIDISQINKTTIKENLSSSYFIPPDLIIKNGSKKYTKGFLLWDSPYSVIYFSEKMFPDFTKSDFNSSIEYWRNNR